MSSELEVTVTVTNVDESGSISAITGAVQAGQTLIAGTVTDPDGSVTGITWQSQSAASGGTYANITGATSAATYTLKAAEVDQTIQVIATYTDGEGPNKSVTSAATVAVVAATVTLSTDADLSSLTLSAGTLTPTFAAATLGYTISMASDVTSTTVTPTTANAAASVTVAGTAVTSGATSGANNLNVGTNAIAIVVTAQDGTAMKTYTVTVTRAAPANTAPTANAGPDQSVTVGATVTLSSSATDPDQANVTLAYAWTQTGGTDVTLSDTAIASPTFTAPDTAGDLVFTLTVTDAADVPASNTATVTITVTAPTPTDTTPPTVAITHNGGASASGAFTATVTFSEPVTGFDINDVSVSAGTTGGFSGTDTTYMLTITPPANLSGSLTISVAARVAMDAAGNSNTAATQASVRFDTTTTTPETPEPPPPAAQSTEEMKLSLGALGRTLAQGVSSVVQGRFHAGPAAESFSQASLLDVWSVHPGTQGTPDLQQLLRGTEFAYALGAVGEDTPVTFWGSGEWRKLSGDPEVGGQRLDYDGDNYGVYVGVDALVEDTLLGVAMGYRALWTTRWGREQMGIS